MLSGKPRLMKTQGQSPLDPCSNIRRSLSAVWTLALTTRQGEGRAQPDSPARPSQPPELIEKTWSPGPSCALPDWSPPSLPSISQFHYPPWPDVHFIKHAIMHSNSCVDKPPLTGPRRDNNNNNNKKCNANSLAHSELMCGFTYRIDPVHNRTAPPSPRLKMDLTLKDITWY